MPSDSLYLPSRRRFLSTAAIGSAALGLGYPAWGQMLPAGKRKLGVAIIGLGSYASGQIGPSLRETKLCELRGVVTGDRDKGLRWARRYGFPESNVYTYENMAELEKNDDIDIVYSITPPLIHHRDVIAGARAGKHVICEKPMTVSVAKCEEMIEACEKAGVKLAMGYRLHYHPYCEQLKKTAADAAWGGPVKMKGGFGSRMATIGWRTSKELAGGGQLMNIGIYVINAALMASGEVEPVSISATEPPKTKPEQFKDFEETIDFRLEFPDGSRCDGTSSGVISSNFFNATAPDKTYDFNPAYSYSGIRMSVDGESVAPVDEFNQQAHQMDAFAAHILFGKPNIVPGEMGLRDMRIITAIYESSRLGKPVRLASI